MSNLRVARRYAEAVMEIAGEQNQADRLAGDFAYLQQAINQSRELLTFLRSPIISKEKKKEIFAEMFGTRMCGVTLSFLNLLTLKGREDALPDIIKEFFRLRDEKLGIITVAVRAPAELTGEQLADIQCRFATMTHKNVKIAFALDKDLRGGFVAKVGDTVFDGSVKRQLEILGKKFIEEV